MRLRNITGSRDVIAESPYVVHEPQQYRSRWTELFGNRNPVYIEVGMGKGQFLYTLAAQNPERNYVGIEKYSSVLLRAIQKMEAEELPNLKFLRMDAELLPTVFAKDEVAGVYLNFSDPWPKDRHAKRRLPSAEFLARYDEITDPSAQIEFKTDNRVLFDFAVEQLAQSAWKADVITYDLHADKELMQGNVMTEYEEKFSAAGNPICKYVLTRKRDAG
ncbi:MAG: tRNA (guanosine(46)-N7)-methyltransferase TrmB [bacterium]|nr:tRNA (guanosine(46)-N7)-methyltransferase TrmB [bacterium]